MTKREKKLSKLSTLARMQTPEWMLEMQRHYRRYGTYRAQDVARMLGDGFHPDGLPTEPPRPGTVSLLQQMANKTKK